MAISTSVARAAFNTGLHGSVNLRLNDITGVSASTPLTIGGNLILTPVEELPNSTWKCEVTQTPRGNNRLIIRVWDGVTG